MRGLRRAIVASRLLSVALAAVLLVAAVSSTSAFAQILNSERIEQTFGSYGIDVLYSDDHLRLSNLYSIEDGHKRMRTFAIVAYPNVIDPAFASSHAAILAGGSIGATFQAGGWEVVKSHLSFVERSVSPVILDAMNLPAGTTLATHGYRLDIVRGGQRFAYATIVEIHHPEYLGLDELIRIYAPEWKPGAEDERAVQRLLYASREAIDGAVSALLQ